jgi:hypothetical protein
VLDDGVSVADVKLAGEHLKQADPRAFPLIVKQQMAAKAEAAGTDMASFAESMIGKEGPIKDSLNRTREVIKQVHLSHGKTPAEAQQIADGAINALEAMRTMGNSAKKIGMPASEVSQTAKDTVTSKIMRMVNPWPVYVRIWAEAGPIEYAAKKKIYAKISEVMTDPNAADMLAEIAKWDRTTEGSKIIGRIFAGMEGQKD